MLYIKIVETKSWVLITKGFLFLYFCICMRGCSLNLLSFHDGCKSNHGCAPYTYTVLYVNSISVRLEEKNMMINLFGHKTLSTRWAISGNRSLEGDSRVEAEYLLRLLMPNMNVLLLETVVSTAGRGSASAAGGSCFCWKRIWNHVFLTQRKGTRRTRLSVSSRWLRSSSSPQELNEVSPEAGTTRNPRRADVAGRRSFGAAGVGGCL